MLFDRYVNSKVVFLRSYYWKFCVVAFWQNIEVCSVLALGNYLSKSSSSLNEMFCDSGRNSSWILFGCQLGEANPTLANYTISTSSEKANRNFAFLNWDLQSTCTEYSTCIQYSTCETWEVKGRLWWCWMDAIHIDYIICHFGGVLT